MKISATEKAWVVVDPTGSASTLGDVMYQASLADLERQFRGGLSTDSHPTLYDDEGEAQADALGRLRIAQIAQLLQVHHARASLGDVCGIELHGADGGVLFRSEVPPIPPS